MLGDSEPRRQVSSRFDLVAAPSRTDLSSHAIGQELIECVERWLRMAATKTDTKSVDWH